MPQLAGRRSGPYYADAAGQVTETTDDTLLAGRLTLRQSRHGHRAGTDAVLLASAIASDAAGCAVDAGAASGAAGLMLAARAPGLKVDLVEINADESALAAYNIAANGFVDRMRVITADVLAHEAAREAAGLVKGAADIIITNPPFLREGAARVSPDPARARAHAWPDDGLTRWCRTLAWLASADAQLAMIHRADALHDIMKALEGRFGALAIRPIHPRIDEPATRIIITARKASRTPLRLLPPLILHKADGQFTPLAAALHAGQASLSIA